MEQETDGKKRIINGILEDTQSEADTIVADAEKTVEQRRENARKQTDTILREADEKISEQTERIKEETESAIATETRRIRLKARDRTIKMVIEEAQKKLEAKIEAPDYPDILLNWIVEAAIGLQAEEAEVNTSSKEMKLITNQLLKKAEKATKKKGELTVHLKKAEDNPLPAQGVVLTDTAGRRAYNNQVPTRINRFKTDIRNLIYKQLDLFQNRDME